MSFIIVLLLKYNWLEKHVPVEPQKMRHSRRKQRVEAIAVGPLLIFSLRKEAVLNAMIATASPSLRRLGAGIFLKTLYFSLDWYKTLPQSDHRVGELLHIIISNYLWN